ncbi:MAG: flippase [Thermoleophilaceae bacterium]|nr:flippase [Thermoleophilaceae bacterium]
MTDPAAGAPPASLVKNSTWMIAARGYAVVVGGALSIYAVRTLSVEDYGLYGTAIALLGILLVFSDVGIASLALRELTNRPGESGGLLGVALAAEIATSVLAVVLMFPLALALGYPGAVIGLLAVGVILLLAQGLQAPLESALNARRVLTYVALLVVVQASVTTAVGFAALGLGAGPAGYLLGIAMGHVAAVALGYYYVRTRIRVRPDFSGSRARIGPFLRTAVPIALTGAITVIYARLDVLMLSKLDSTEAVAIYHVPLALTEYALVVPGILATAFFPVLAESLRENARAARGQFVLVLRIFVLIAIPLAIFLGVAGGDLLSLIFGERYRASGTVLAIIAASVPLGFLNYLLWYGILAGFGERPVVLVMVVGLVLNAALNVILIPPHGPEGAAAALIASDAFVVAGQAIVLRRRLFGVPWARLAWKPLAAGVLAAGAAALLLPVSGLLAGPVAALVFAVALLALRYVSREEWAPLTDAMRGVR